MIPFIGHYPVGTLSIRLSGNNENIIGKVKREERKLHKRKKERFMEKIGSAKS